MPRRTATPATPAPPAPLPPPPRDLDALDQSDPEWAANLRTLRRHWKWANFSQFFYTFADLLAVPDVFLSDVEDDLARGTNLYLPRLMHRLLYTLSQDRKLNIDNWQTALRRQYLRRDPAANPIGPEPKVPSRESSVAPSENGDEQDPKMEQDSKDAVAEAPDEPKPVTDGEAAEGGPEGTAAPATPQGDSSEPKKEEDKDGDVPIKDADEPEPKVEEEEEESKDWLELPMLEKLDSLHLLTEWQFQNPYRLRQIMKDDGDTADWRIEPIGYDAKTNAYWLIGPDRLWIQRVPPKPPRNRNLKRKRAAPKKAPTPVPESSSDDGEEPPAPTKRTRLQTQSSRSNSRAQPNGRASRAARRASRSAAAAVEEESPSPGKSTRAAKVQANKKLDLQAKELAEFQRQSAALARSSPRKAASAAHTSPSKRAMGTRVSARLRHAARGAEDEDEDGDEEWQQVPDEWLRESATPQRRTRARGKGVPRPRPPPEDSDEEGDAEEEQAADVERAADEEQAADGEHGGEDEGGDGGEEGDGGENPSPDEPTEDHELLQKAGLESGSVSDLTDLSDQAEDDEDEEAEEAAPRKTRRSTRKRSGGGGGGRRKSTRQARRARAPPAKTEVKAEETDASEPKTKTKAKSKPAPAEDQDQEMEMEPPAPPVPEGFVEWEAIAVTLAEWESVAEPFAKATHYLEKALYKMLTQNIVPEVTATLREAERKKRMEEAVVHRKRSSRIALKESEKEEARIAAKKKAEEEEKLARSRRQEARQKKDDDERAKRDKAREQRRKERDEREARAVAKAERAAREEAAAARSTATPSVNGTQPSSSVQPSRVVTPNGVRTPNWMLDCEVCGKHGVNLDEGHDLVCCGSCNRWQHIACHDLQDQRHGRPKCDWTKQQFFCTRCRQRSAAYAASRQQQYAWPQTSHPVHLRKTSAIDSYTSTSDVRYSHRMENGMSYPPQQQYAPAVGGTSYSRSSYSTAAGLYSSYAADQRGLSSLRGVADPSQWGASNGYAPVQDPLIARTSSGHFASQFGQNGYSNSRASSAYPAHAPSPSLSQYNGTPDPLTSTSSARWEAPATNGYTSPGGTAAHDAARSLAFMHESGGSGRYNGSTWPIQQQSSSYGHGQLPATSPAPTHLSSSFSHSPPPPAGIDPLTGRSFARVEHGGSHTNGATSSSFNFP